MLVIKYLKPVGQSSSDEDADQEIEENRLRHRKVKQCHYSKTIIAKRIEFIKQHFDE